MQPDLANEFTPIEQQVFKLDEKNIKLNLQTPLDVWQMKSRTDALNSYRDPGIKFKTSLSRYDSSTKQSFIIPQASFDYQSVEDQVKSGT